METNVIPVLNLEELQAKANEAAQKGALDAITEFYTSYNSPYKKAIEENLKNKGLDHSINIPDIIGILNQSISQEIDLIASTAISKTFVPLVKKFLTREDAEVNFSDILKKFIEITDYQNNEDLHYYEYIVERKDSSTRGFFNYRIFNNNLAYELHFFEYNNTTTIISLPNKKDESRRYYSGYESKQTMKIYLDGGASLELPFTKGILEDEFVSYIARLVIGNTNIIFDVKEFDYDMFPDRDECSCD